MALLKIPTESIKWEFLPFPNYKIPFGSLIEIKTSKDIYKGLFMIYDHETRRIFYYPHENSLVGAISIVYNIRFLEPTDIVTVLKWASLVDKAYYDYISGLTKG